MKSISEALRKQADAYISECENYRYWLTRVWDRSLPLLPWGALNPSTADALKDDATVRVMCGRSQQLGYGGIVLWNLFAYRATDPKVMKAAADPVGPENMEVILSICRRYPKVMCAWGADGSYLYQARKVIAMLMSPNPWNRRISLWHLGLTQSGHPKHPLRIPYSLEPVLWKFQQSRPKSIRVKVEKGVDHGAESTQTTA